MRAHIVSSWLVLLAGAAWAQDSETAEAERAATARFLEGLAEHDPGLCTTYRFGYYALGQRNMGHLEVKVERAAEGEGYTAKLEGEIRSFQAAGAKTLLFLDAELGADLGVTRSTFRNERRDGSGALLHRKQDRLRSAGGEFVWTTESLGEEETHRGAITGPNHTTWASKILLARKVPLKPGLVLRLQATGLEDKGGYVLSPTTVRVLEPRKVRLRGVDLRLTPVRLESTIAAPLEFDVDADHQVVRIRMDDVAAFVAGDEQQVKQDLNAEDPGLGTAKQVVVRYLTITGAKQGKLEDAFALVDWSAVYAAWAKRDPGIAQRGEEAFVVEFQASLRAQGVRLNQAQVQAMGLLLRATKVGDDVQVEIPGYASSTRHVVRRQADGSWKIVALPR